MRTSTSPLPGSGKGRMSSRRTSGPPNSWMRMACMLFIGPLQERKPPPLRAVAAGSASVPVTADIVIRVGLLPDVPQTAIMLGQILELIGRRLFQPVLGQRNDIAALVLIIIQH